MVVAVEKDVARGSGVKSFDDVEIQSHGTMSMEERGDGDDEFMKENDKQFTWCAIGIKKKSKENP